MIEIKRQSNIKDLHKKTMAKKKLYWKNKNNNLV
jgi:hypothetical protein